MKLSHNPSRPRWRCSTGEKEAGLRSSSWLHNTKLPFLTVVRFLYCWIQELTSIEWCRRDSTIPRGDLGSRCPRGHPCSHREPAFAENRWSGFDRRDRRNPLLQEEKSCRQDSYPTMGSRRYLSIDGSLLRHRGARSFSPNSTLSN